MTKLIFSFLLALLSVAANAQWTDICTGQPTTVPPGLLISTYDPAKDVICDLPTTPVIRTNSFGVMGYRYCKGTTQYNVQFAASTWDFFSKTPSMVYDLLLAGLNPSNSTINVIAKKYGASVPISDPSLTKVWCPFWAEMVTNKPQMPPSWITERITTYQTNGYSILPPLGRAVLGTPCDCKKPLVIGALTYCTFQGASSVTTVAACKKN
jgi:hypothetical protein